MAKFEIEMEITGLKVKIRGERDDIPVITSNLGQQITGMLQPASNIVEGLPAAKSVETAVIPPEVKENGSKSRPRGRARKVAATGNGDASTLISWTHDPGKWGTPSQTWTAWQKTLWLLYVVLQEKDMKELTARQIAETFNTHFRQAGQIQKNSMPKELGNLKQRTPSLVSDCADKSPITWFLTDAGIKEALKLVSDAKGPTNLYSQPENSNGAN